MINSCWATEQIDDFIAECYKTMIVREIHRLVIEKFPEAQGRTISAIKHRIAFLKKVGKIDFNRNDDLIYSSEEIEWLKKRCENYDFTYETLTQEFNEKFNKNKPLSAIRLYCWKNFKLEWKKHNCVYSPYQRQWLIENYHKYLIKDLFVKFNEKFNTSKSFSAICSYCKDTLKLRNINYAQISKKEGFVGSNKEFGSEHMRDGYIMIKVSNEGTKRQRWIPKQRYIWEQHHGKIPEGHKIMFLDGNNRNFDINNLVCVDNSIICTIRPIIDCSIKLKKLKIVNYKLNQILSELQNG